MQEDVLVEETSPEEEPEIEVPAQATLADLKKARREAENLRKRLKEAQDQVLASRFDGSVLDLIPEEVTDFERRVALAEKFQAAVGSTKQEPPQTEVATPEAPKEEPTAQELNLAAVSQGSADTGVPHTELLTVKEIKELSKTDPAKAERLIREGKFQQQTNW